LVFGPRLDLSTLKSPKLELIIEFHAIFITKISGYWWCNRVYHCVDTGNAFLISQSPHRLPLCKRVEVYQMLKNIKVWREVE
jgi:hypothetical protein